MTEADSHWSSSFAALFKKSYIEYADCEASFTTQPLADDELISRLHVVARTASGHVIVCRSEQGWRFLPGGTRERGETLQELAQRELLEEAGARVNGDVRLFASHVVESFRSEPYKPHLPHPRSHWAYALVDAEVVLAPTNPADVEQIVEVLALPPREAADYLAVHDPVHADVVRLAQAMGLLLDDGV